MSTTAPTESSETKELGLVGKVELRIALADSDSKLESILKTFLAPLLLKLASEHVSVRNKVISVCQHINTRIKPLSIKLPVASLLKQFKEQSAPLIRHFDLFYIQQGIDRILTSERVNLLPLLLQGLAADAAVSANHGASLFNLFLRLLPHFSLPQRGSKEDLELRVRLGLVERPDDARFIASWSGKLLLLSINRASDPTSRTLTNTTCPGLSVDEYGFLTLHGKGETWNPAVAGGLNLTETKVAVVNFLASGAFLDSERFLPALFASADTNSRISDIADDILKRVQPSISLEDSALISNLYELYFGQSGTTAPVRPPLRLKIIGLLCKSRIATTQTSLVIKLVEQGIIPSEVDGEGGSGNPSGREASKLHGQIFAFTNWVARMGSPDDLKLIAPKVISSLRDFIEQRGWPKPFPERARLQDELSLRGYGYESIGLLAKACPNMLLDPHLDLLRWLFSSLSEDDSGGNIAVSVEEALGSALGVFAKREDEEIQDALRALLLHHMKLTVGQPASTSSTVKVCRSTRYITVRYANRCLPYRDVVARWIDILAIGLHSVERSEVVEEGKKGLDIHWFKLLHTGYDKVSEADSDNDSTILRLPRFEELVEYILSKLVDVDVDDLQQEHDTALDSTDTLEPSLAYCRRMLLSQATADSYSAPSTDADWERRQDTAITTDENIRARVKTYLRNMTTGRDERPSQALYKYLVASYKGLTWNNGEGLGQCGDYFLQVCSLSPDMLVGQIASEVSGLQRSIYSNNHATRSTAAQAFGIIASHENCPATTLEACVQSFIKQVKTWKDAIGAEANKCHGAMLALAYLLSRLAYRQRADALPVRLKEAFLSEVLDVVMNANDKTLRDAAHAAVSQLSLFSVLRPENFKPPNSITALVSKLIEDAKSGNEKAIVTIGHLAMALSGMDAVNGPKEILEPLYGLQELRQSESQFAVGEALCVAAAGWESKSLIAVLDVEGPRPSTPSQDLLPEVLEKVLSDCKSNKPSLRKACSIWLLCIVQFCGHLPPVLDRLRRCQTAFRSFLADRDSLVQETASRGLSIIYEKGDKDLRDDLVRDLVGSFTSTTPGLAGNVTAETELFEPGALPTGDGSITTYKDIMSLASEVGDPSLVYKFMSLASDNAIWSSRAAFGRFGLSNILSDSSVDGYVAQNPKLYAKLYRYRFDPNQNVRSAMNDIWAALVKDSTSTINRYFDGIMEDLLSSILGKEWRVRQASCAALADLVQGRPFDMYEKYLSRIWSQTFRVMDDVKSSVRDAAMSLARVLTSILVRSLEAGDSSSQSAEMMLKNVLPFLLSPSGLESSATDVQGFALQTLLELIKKANGKNLRAFVPELIERLLGLLSSLEPQAVNYVHLNADKYGMTAQQIDDMRLTSIRASPMMEAIERCLDLVDEPTMKEVCRSIERAIKNAVGLPSKVGCSRVLVSLSTRHSFLFRAYSDEFLRLLKKLVLDRNDTVSSSYATACGYLVRLASDKEILRLVSFCRKLYFESEDERHRVVAGDIVYATSKYSTDRFSSMAAEFLPLTFIAKHDTHDHVKELFQNTWNENVGGSRAVLLYLQEILQLGTQYLDSPRWVIKHASALAVADTVTALGSDVGLANAKLVWHALEKALSGKTWEGKEKVLKAFVEFINKAKSFWQGSSEIEAKMRTIMLREARRNSPSYRQHALLCLKHLVDAFDAINMFEDVYSLVGPFIRDSVEDDDEMDIDSAPGKESSNTIREAAIAAAVGSLLHSLNPSKGPDICASLSQVLDLVKSASTVKARVVKDAIFEGEELVFSRLHAQELPPLTENAENILIELSNNLFDPTHQDEIESLRLKRAKAVFALARISKGRPRLTGVLERGIAGARDAERSDSVRKVLDQAISTFSKSSP